MPSVSADSAAVPRASGRSGQLRANGLCYLSEEGGRECFGFGYEGASLRYEARYYDIVPGQRIIYSYEMYADGARISVSVATVDFRAAAGGTGLTWTEQGAYLDGFDGAEAARLREGGVAEMLDGLGKYLA